jgi:hypothetical protein
MINTHAMEPTTHGLEPIDAAVLMKKYVALLGMINYGTPEQKLIAKREIQELDKTIHKHLNSISFDAAQRNLGFSEGELDALNQPIS